MTDERLAEIQERLDKATPGPREGAVAPRAEDELSKANPQSRANADFIAHAREDIPFLRAELERYKDVVARAVAELQTSIGAGSALSILATLKEGGV